MGRTIDVFHIYRDRLEQDKSWLCSWLPVLKWTVLEDYMCELFINGQQSPGRKCYAKILEQDGKRLLYDYTVSVNGLDFEPRIYTN